MGVHRCLLYLNNNHLTSIDTRICIHLSPTVYAVIELHSAIAFFRSREISELYDMEKKKRMEKEAKRYELDAEINRLTAQQEDTEVMMNKLKNDNADLRDNNTRLKSVSQCYQYTPALFVLPVLDTII